VNTKQINIRLDESTKKAAERVFSQLGLAPSEAVRLFYRQVALRRGLPFALRVPNKKTSAALDELEAGGGGKAKKLDAFYKDLGLD